MKELVFYGSSVAALLQRNPYTKLSESFEVFFKAHHPVEFAHVFSKTRSQKEKTKLVAKEKETFFQQIDQLAKNTKEVKEVQKVQKIIQATTRHDIDRASKEYKETLQEHKALEQNLSESLAKQLGTEFQGKTASEVIRNELKKEGVPEETRKVLENSQHQLQISRARVAKVFSALESAEITKEETRKHTNTQFGIRFEKSALQVFTDQYKVQVQTPSQMFRKKAFEFEGYPVVLAGKIDGWIPGTPEDPPGKVIEIKNRVKRFFPNLVEYEKVQLMVYLFIMNAKDGYLIQTMKTSETKIDAKLYSFDEPWFEELLLDLKAFVAKYLELVESPEMLEEYSDCLTSQEKENYLKRLFSW